jgi:hypothetical protein
VISLIFSLILTVFSFYCLFKYVKAKAAYERASVIVHREIDAMHKTFQALRTTAVATDAQEETFFYTVTCPHFGFDESFVYPMAEMRIHNVVYRNEHEQR